MNKVLLDPNLKSLAENIILCVLLFFIILTLQRNFLNSILLNKFYEDLNNKYNENHNSNSCEKALQPYTNNYRYIYEYCNKVSELINKWDNIIKSYTNYDNLKLCNYFGYWFYDKVIEKKPNLLIVKFLYDILKVLNKNNYKNKCLPNNYNVHKEAFKNKKQLFEFIEYYDFIKNTLSSTLHSEREKYCDYISHIFGLRYAMAQEDKCKNSSIYENDIKNFDEKVNKKDRLFIEISCPHKNLEVLFKKIYELKEEIQSTKDLITNSDEQAHLNIKNVMNFLHRKIKKINLINIPYFIVNIIYADNLFKLSSYNIYETLNSTHDIDSFCKYCINILMLETDYPGAYVLCKKLARNLKKKLSNIEGNEDNHGDRCLYFIYWTYREISKISLDSSKNIFEIPVFIELLKVANNINYEFTRKDIIKRYKHLEDEFKNNYESLRKKFRDNTSLEIKCNANRNKFIGEWTRGITTLSEYMPCFYSFDCKLDECKEMMNLFNYFKNHNNIKSTISESKNDCERYNIYLENIKDLYKKHKKECCDDFWEDHSFCPNYFKCNNNYNPFFLLHELKCNGKHTRYSQDYARKSERHKQNDRNGDHNSSVGASTVKFKCRRWSSRNDAISDKIICEDENKTIEDAVIPRVSNSFPGILNANSDDSSGILRNIRKILTSRDLQNTLLLVISLVGVILIILFLYKFTTFGSIFLNKILKKNKNTLHWDYENSMFMLENNSRRKNIKSKNRAYHVIYQNV
ncbi:variable surface protein [Plasmodium gonderi]|uniref:Variable surface protein n=1 Tax=Plasmodium gonderi TaxID=77519 RepID=A0A1Y1JJQ6_PLAGO|nr:variable surface protein [Plasmodium gonderi]GAW82736.1 variable surface protein [Plasmodium gonderi]